MTDERLRGLARGAETGDVNARARLLSERVRLGELSERRIAVAAYLGDAGARLALSGRAPQVMPIEPEGVDLRFWRSSGAAQGPPTLEFFDADRLAGTWVAAWRALDSLLLPAALVALARSALPDLPAGLRASVEPAISAAAEWIVSDGTGPTKPCEAAVAAAWPSARPLRDAGGRPLGVAGAGGLRSLDRLVFLAATGPFHGPAEQHSAARDALRDLALSWGPGRVRAVLAERLVAWALCSSGRSA